MVDLPDVVSCCWDGAAMFGICLHCQQQAWNIHCKENNARFRGAILHPVMALKLALWRAWIYKRIPLERGLWRDVYLAIGSADSYVRVKKTNAHVAMRTA